MDNNYQSEQLEEGEIVDDDDLEAISDNSIIDSTFGKFVSSNENLCALSLSSDSETEVYRNAKHKKKLLQRKNRIKHQKKRKRHRSSSDSSDSDVSSCRDLKGKLKEAIRISGIEGTHKNTLETRLKGMGGIGNNNKSATSAPEPTPQVDNDSDKIDDNELEKLRIEALKTAVLNKFQRRKKKKALLEEQKEEMKPLGTQENKENDTPKKEHSVVNNSHTEKVETKAPVIDLEEDEDVLRASLLAGLAKKITRVQPTNENSVKTKPVAPKLPVQTASVLPKRPVNHFNNSNNINKNKVVQNRPKPQVKPLIININDDSDSEEESKQKPADPPQKLTDLKVITNSVEKFLKEQRAKFETETKKRFQIVNTVKNKTILEKSAVKLLPKSQQIEYQQLLKRLKNAERKKRAKKIALQKLTLATAQKPPQIIEPTTADQVTIELCPKQTTVEVISTAETAPTPKVEVIVKPVVEVKSSAEDTSKSDSNSASSEQPSKGSDSSERKKGGITNELTTLQKTLKEIKMQKNGSLQIKSKYQVLTPIIRKITATSNERKKQEQRIKNLLEELNEARNKLAKSHETFTALVRELVDKKEKIDKSCEDAKTDKKTENGNIIKKHIVKIDKRQERHKENGKKDAKSVPVTSTPIKPQPNRCVMEEATISTIITNCTNNDYEDMDVCNSDETDMCQIDIVDPNDIDQIFKRKSIVKSTIPEYVSPLNFNTYERYRHVDPLGIMCPYEVNGSCRDIDCTFKHYLKNHERL